MMTKQSFRSFFEAAPIMENIQAAKDYLLKQYAEKKKVKPSELSDEEKKQVLLNPKFIEIRDLVAKQPGYALPFLVFYTEQKAHIEELQEILDYLNKFKGQLSELSMPVADFSKIVPTKDDPRPGYEHLGDELRNIERRRKLKDLYNELTPKMKKQFNKATVEQIEDLTAISNQLKSLPDIVSKEDEQSLNAWKSFSKTMKKYDDTRTYPEYADEKKAFGDILKDALDFIDSWGQGEDALLKKLKELGPQVGIIYAKKGYVVMSARTPEAQRAVCADTSWCIRTDSTFWSYGGGRIQINIINKNLPVTNDLSLIGMTINPNGTIHTDATRPNSRLRDGRGSTFKTYIDALEGLDYPSDLIKEVEAKFQREVDIKLALEHYYKDGSNLSPRKVVESLITMSKGFLAGVMPQEDWERISGIVAQIIFEDKGLTKGSFMKIFKENGIYVEATWNVFDSLIGKDYTKEEMEEIGESTKSGLEAMEELLEIEDTGALGMRKSDVDAMREVVSNKKWVLEQISKRM
jgi:hypothetical protein